MAPEVHLDWPHPERAGGSVPALGRQHEADPGAIRAGRKRTDRRTARLRDRAHARCNFAHGNSAIYSAANLRAWRVLVTGFLGGAVATHVRIGSPVFTHDLFGAYLGVVLWGGRRFREPNLRALIPLRMKQQNGAEYWTAVSDARTAASDPSHLFKLTH